MIIVDLYKDHSIKELSQIEGLKLIEVNGWYDFSKMVALTDGKSYLFINEQYGKNETIESISNEMVSEFISCVNNINNIMTYIVKAFREPFSVITEEDLDSMRESEQIEKLEYDISPQENVLQEIFLRDTKQYTNLDIKGIENNVVLF